MHWPFTVWALPRSRTAWLQCWLGGPVRCGHDLAIGVASPQQWLDRLWHGLGGTVETGAPELGLLAQQAMPGHSQVVIRRPVDQVLASLRVAGVEIARFGEELERREHWLGRLEASGVPSVRFEELNDPECCAWLFEHLTGLPFQFDWWQVASARNVQINIQASVARQAELGEQFTRCQAKIELALTAPPRWLRVGREPWESFWLAAQQRVHADHLMTWDGEFPGRPFSVDVKMFEDLQAQGKLLIATARRNGVLVGYALWVLGTCGQSAGTPLASLGPMFVEPKQWAVAKRLIDWSIDSLRRLGYLNLNWHFPNNPRSRSLGRHLAKLGARPIHLVYAQLLEPQNG